MLRFRVEISKNAKSSNDAKGALLEHLVSDFLASQNYDVIERIRFTGSEIDILATSRIDGERIVVECKSQNSPIDSQTVRSLVGLLVERDIDKGWLVATSTLGKEAKGIREELQKPRRGIQLTFFEPDFLIDCLIRSNTLCDPNQISISSSSFSQEVFLFVSEFGRFWIFEHTQQLGLPDGTISVFRAEDGTPISDPAFREKIQLTESRFSGCLLAAPNIEKPPLANDDLFQSIVNVPIADEWRDYRPSRPIDFVGRRQLISGIRSFLEDIAASRSQTRIFAIKGPSGWGKSSLIVKLKNDIQESRDRKQLYVAAFDARAAVTADYPLLALVKGVLDAKRSGFIKSDISKIETASDPFKAHGFLQVFQELRDRKKAIVIIFDQFEEVLRRSELEPLFLRFQELCFQLDEYQEPLSIGFSWKTDGTLRSDHGAYYMWHSLADRRKEFFVDKFSASDAESLVKRFSVAVSQKILPPVRRFVIDQSQGYPWLAKKITIHLHDLIFSGSIQESILQQSMRIEEMFEKDLSALSAKEIEALKYISQNAPIEIFEVAEVYGDEVCQYLLDKRILVRSGSRITPYWDIFRDFIITREVPKIPISYVPWASFTIAAYALQNIPRDREVSYAAISALQRITEQGADNLVRDMVTIGIGTHNRQKGQFNLNNISDADIESKLLHFCQNHVIFSIVRDRLSQEAVVTAEGIAGDVLAAYSYFNIKANSAHIYATRMLNWFSRLGLLQKVGSRYTLGAGRSNFISDDIELARDRYGVFLAAAPPEAVIHLCQQVSNGERSASALNKLKLRNAIIGAKQLGLIEQIDDVLQLKFNIRELLPTLLNSVKKSETYRFAVDVRALNTLELGQAVGGRFGFHWSSSSCKRYGNGFGRWIDWVNNQPSEHSEPLLFV